MSQYSDYLENKSLEEKSKNEKERTLLFEKVNFAVTELVSENKDILKVILFGSIIEKDNFKPHSDVDLYIEGLLPENYFRARTFFEEKLSREIDLYTETDNNLLLEEIFKKGTVLYERKT